MAMLPRTLHGYYVGRISDCLIYKGIIPSYLGRLLHVEHGADGHANAIRQ